MYSETAFLDLAIDELREALHVHQKFCNEVLYSIALNNDHSLYLIQKSGRIIQDLIGQAMRLCVLDPITKIMKDRSEKNVLTLRMYIQHYRLDELNRFLDI